MDSFKHVTIWRCLFIFVCGLGEGMLTFWVSMIVIGSLQTTRRDGFDWTWFGRSTGRQLRGKTYLSWRAHVSFMFNHGFGSGWIFFPAWLCGFCGCCGCVAFVALPCFIYLSNLSALPTNLIYLIYLIYLSFFLSYRSIYLPTYLSFFLSIFLSI